MKIYALLVFALLFNASIVIAQDNQEYNPDPHAGLVVPRGGNGGSPSKDDCSYTSFRAECETDGGQYYIQNYVCEEGEEIETGRLKCQDGTVKCVTYEEAEGKRAICCTQDMINSSSGICGELRKTLGSLAFIVDFVVRSILFDVENRFSLNPESVVAHPGNLQAKNLENVVASVNNDFKNRPFGDILGYLKEIGGKTNEDNINFNNDPDFSKYKDNIETLGHFLSDAKNSLDGVGTGNLDKLDDVIRSFRELAFDQNIRNIGCGT